MVDEKNLYEDYVSTEEIFDGKILHVIKDTVKLPNGNTTYREVIRHIGAEKQRLQDLRRGAAQNRRAA